MAGRIVGRDRPAARSPRSIGDTRAADELLRTLRRCQAFTAVSSPELRAILTLAQERHIAKRATVFLQGDRPDSVYVVIQGKVKLLLTGPNGRGIILSFLGPGGMFGYLAPIAGTVRACTAEAIEQSRLLAWPAGTFEKILKRYPIVAMNTLRLIAQQLQADWGRLHDLATEPVARRLARTILRLGGGRGHRRTPTLSMMQQDLAELLGTTPPTLSRILGRWEARGLVIAGRELVTITHPEGLTKIAEIDDPIGRASLRRQKNLPSKS